MPLPTSNYLATLFEEKPRHNYSRRSAAVIAIVNLFQTDLKQKFVAMLNIFVATGTSHATEVFTRNLI